MAVPHSNPARAPAVSSKAPLLRFIGIARAQTTNLAIAAPGIAGALLATGIGRVAAIPAQARKALLPMRKPPIPGTSPSTSHAPPRATPGRSGRRAAAP